MYEVREAPIGVFDSGVGGLTVVREIMRQIPQERIVYFGDTARVPYGTKSRDTVIRYSRQIVRFLKTRNVKAIVIACNTASAYALETLQEETDLPMIGVVKPGARVASRASTGGKIGVIATEATVGSHIYREYIQGLKPESKVFEKACPLFVSLVEEGWLKDPITEAVAQRYLQEMKELHIDTLILGCTHYPLIRSTVRKVIGEEVALINPAYETAIELRELLKREKIDNQEHHKIEKNPYEFFVSDAAERFKTFANSILDYDITNTRQINIEEY
ncbi:MAG: glutamate racemase [Lachnospiraceae bacterium]|jgi:glutamate racemase|nr:glutamate racemase [Lachnospiraceae bacterium]